MFFDNKLILKYEFSFRSISQQTKAMQLFFHNTLATISNKETFLQAFLEIVVNSYLPPHTGHISEALKIYLMVQNT